MLARRDYSRARLRARLLAKNYPRDEVETALDQCAGYGYLDDHRFGRSRLETRLARRPAGRRDALRDLQRQGLTATMSESVADEVYDEAGGEAAVLEDAFERWVARHGEPQDIAAAKRCFDHLMRRTFPRHLVLQKLSPWLDEITS
jgi:SOS response regulatory protein OraA/RecX